MNSNNRQEHKGKYIRRKMDAIIDILVSMGHTIKIKAIIITENVFNLL